MCMIKTAFLGESSPLGHPFSSCREGYVYYQSSPPAWALHRAPQLPGSMAASPSSSVSGSPNTRSLHLPLCYQFYPHFLLIFFLFSSGIFKLGLHCTEWLSSSVHPSPLLPCTPGNCLPTISSQAKSSFLVISSSCTSGMNLSPKWGLSLPSEWGNATTFRLPFCPTCPQSLLLSCQYHSRPLPVHLSWFWGMLQSCRFCLTVRWRHHVT